MEHADITVEVPSSFAAMQSALAAVKEGRLSITKASKEYNVSQTTLRNKLSGKHMGAIGGHNRKFTLDEEKVLLQILDKIERVGIRIPKQPVIRHVLMPVMASKGLDPEKFTVKYSRTFFKRHKAAIKATTELGASTDQGTEQSGREKWLSLLSQLHIDGYLDRPEGIFSLDESHIAVSSKNARIVGRRKKKDEASDDTDDDLITVLACANALGFCSQPLIHVDGSVYIGVRPDGSETKPDTSDPDGNGDLSVIARYMKSEVIPGLRPGKNVIFVDDSTSGTNDIELIAAIVASDKEARVVRLPADQKGPAPARQTLSVCGPVRCYWKELLKHYFSAPNTVVTKRKLAEFIMTKWHTCDPVDPIMGGFREIGISPYDVDLISTSVSFPLSRAAPSDFQTMYRDQLETLRECLRKIPPLTSACCIEIVQLLIEKVEGTAPPATDIGATFRSALLNSVMSQTIPQNRGLSSPGSSVREADEVDEESDSVSDSDEFDDSSSEEKIRDRKRTPSQRSDPKPQLLPNPKMKRLI